MLDDAAAAELVVEQVAQGGAVQLSGRGGQSANGRVGADGLQPDRFVLHDLAGGFSGGDAAGDEVADAPQALQIGGGVPAMPARRSCGWGPAHSVAATCAGSRVRGRARGPPPRWTSPLPAGRPPPSRGPGRAPDPNRLPRERRPCFPSQPPTPGQT